MRTLLSTLALAASMSLFAQDADTDNDKKTPEEKAAKKTEQMTKDLGLNAEQTAKVSTINLNFARSNQEVKQLKDQASQEGRSKALKDKRDADLKLVLTPEQFNKMLELRAKKEADKDKKKEKAHNE